MSFWTALKLSFNNIKTKKGRTALTAFASSIGIIGIALIFSLSNGFQTKIDEYEEDTLSQMPITISTQAVSYTHLDVYKRQGSHSGPDQTAQRTFEPDAAAHRLFFRAGRGAVLGLSLIHI